MQAREYQDQGRTIAFRVPGEVWAQIGALMKQRKARASVVLRQLVATGLAVEAAGQSRTPQGAEGEGDER